MKRLLFSMTLAVLGIVSQSAICAGPASAPTASTVTPPSSGYSYFNRNSDEKGSFRIYLKNITGGDQIGKNPKYWLKVTRFTNPSDEKTEYPAEYLRFDVDCKSQTYVVTARYEFGSDGHDRGPVHHVISNPVRLKLPGAKNGVSSKQPLSLPERVAAGMLQNECFPGE